MGKLSIQEEDFDKLVEMVMAENYKEAMEFYDQSSLSDTFEGYEDSKTYFFYAQALLNYENGIYGEAYDLLAEYCQGFLEADQIRQEIDSKIGSMDGVYVNKSVDYEMYIIINKGLVAMEFESQQFVNKSISYLESLCKYTFTTGKETFAVCSSMRGEVSDVSYIMATIGENGDSFILGAPEGSDNTTFSGAYERTSLKIPSKKQ